ncbi:YebG family protein [Ningiella sp. W23]|uniref:YebG family protein n=1 Tax=Ningiella sp. W23 TaxID=3023715 RepID=UPI003757805C
MAVITQYVVQHKGIDKLVTTDKKEADQYDKMLGIADNLSLYIQHKGIELDDQIAEDLSILLAKNKDAVAKLLRGTDADSILEAEKADIVDMQQKKQA